MSSPTGARAPQIRSVNDARKDDPREPPLGACQIFDFSREQPDEITPAGSRVWRVRTQRATIDYTSAAAEETFALNVSKEHVVILPHENCVVRVDSLDGAADVTGQAVIVVPAGPSQLTTRDACDLVSVLEIRSAPWVASRNDAFYADAEPPVALESADSSPSDGKLRVYPMSAVGMDAHRFGRIVAGAEIMVNFAYPLDGPRDPGTLSPHSHDDIEQITLCVEGSFAHHFRTPWRRDKSNWREDVHELVGSPSVAIIPEGNIHTTAHAGAGRNQLMDIFVPGRVDFLENGWVLDPERYAS